MKIFISWSGDRSKKYGEILRNWIPSVIQAAEPYFTPDDIEKGSKWAVSISNELSDSKFGIFCLTKDNLKNPWILFEAGAISKTLSGSFVCPILFDPEASPSDLPGPLSQFQSAVFEKSEMLKIVTSINAQCSPPLKESILISVFDKWWPDLEREIVAVRSSALEVEKNNSKMSDRQMLQELLITVRILTKDMSFISDEVRKTRIFLRGNWLPQQGIKTFSEFVEHDLLVEAMKERIYKKKEESDGKDDQSSSGSR